MIDDTDLTAFAEDLDELEAFLRFQDVPFRPISEYDGKQLAVLSDGTDWTFGCRHNGKWCSMFDGDYYPKEGFEPIEFKAVPDELIVGFAH